LPPSHDPPFWIPVQWQPPLPVTTSTSVHGTDIFGRYWGHATFLAGLIRLTAPDAQVLSLQVMNGDGSVNEANVSAALHWLADHTENGHVVDVVLMAFGRPRDPGEGDPPLLTEAIGRLGEKNVKIVASAGNNASDKPTIPASLAEGLDSPVVSVGAGNSEAVHAHYSNHGYWVHEWRCGTDVISIMPLAVREHHAGHAEDPEGAVLRNGYARWSGTSFSAAIYAGELAHARAAERAAGSGP
jgi:subtilisin family serine protease